MSTIIHILGSAILILSLWLFQKSSRGKFESLPRIGRNPGWFNQNVPRAKLEYQANGRAMIKDAYRKYGDTNFLVQTVDMQALVVAPKFLAEIRMLPETKMSHSVALVEKFLGHYTGVNVILESRQHINVCRIQLTQNLDIFVPRMAKSYAKARDQFLGQFPLGTPVPAYGFIFTMVLAITSTVFVGEELAQDPAWQEVVSAYMKEVVGVAKALRPFPRIIRPLLRPFLVPEKTIHGIYAKANKILAQPILERQDPSSKHLDVMAFLSQAQDEPSPRRIILQLMVLVSAALHTSTMAAVQALYDLCIYPETAAELREEVTEVLPQTHGTWELGTIKKLVRLDSFLKESFRWNQPESLGYSRVSTSQVTLSDGTTIPPGSFVNMAAEAMSRDPEFYDDPDTFRPRRFLRSGETSTNQSQEHEFAGIEKGNIAWGSGRSTCPGRWFASAMNKLIVGDLLHQYEISLPAGQRERPASVHDNGSIVPNPTQGLLFTATSVSG